jgi:pimeloyl-ACP methyl ester carboxylesterase
VYALQDVLVFPGAARGAAVETPVVQGVSVDWLVCPDGSRFRYATAEADAPRAVLLLFLGNGEDLRSGVPKAEELTGYGAISVVPEYPGYGESEGRPSVASLYACAEAAAAYAGGIAAERGLPLVVVGTSLGSFPAVYLASRGIGDRLLLAAPPTSIAEAGARRYPWLPVRSLIRHRFDSLALAPDVRCPTLVVHGDRDDIVPMDMGERLARALRGEFIRVEGHGHWWLLAPSGPVRGEVSAFLQGG